MMSLAEQLRRLALPVSSSYETESVRRKSLVYEDPSRVDCLSCYQESLQAFENLAKRDEMFEPFRETLFAETTCRLEICNLLQHQKEKLDIQISKFLCFVSPFLRHYDSIRALEWLVYRFQVHLYNVEDLIRCVLPYHETGLFAKFLQLIDFQSCAKEFQWMKPYAVSGNSLPRPHLIRECLRNRTFIPFLASSILKAVKISEDISPVHLNDLTNFFLSTMTAFCESSISDKKLARVIDQFQHVITAGLRSSSCPPFQSATCLVFLRIALKLRLNHDLVLSWLELLLKHSRPGNAWETLRLTLKIMRSQQIAMLPSHLLAVQSTLMCELSETERSLIEQDESNLLHAVDVNVLASNALSDSSDVRAATLTVEVNETSEPPKPLILKRVKPVYNDETLLKDHQPHVELLHSLLASLPNGSCLFRDSSCNCPKLDSTASQPPSICELLYTILENGSSNERLSKFEVRRSIRLLQLVRSAFEAHLANVKCEQTSHKTRSSIALSSNAPSNYQHILEDCLDQALPLVSALLLHPAPSVRCDAYSLLSSWLNELAVLTWTPDATHLRLIRATSFIGRCSTVFSEELRELLRSEPLSGLTRVAKSLITLVIQLLFSEPLSTTSNDFPIDAYGRFCWTYALRLLSSDTVNDLVAIKCDNSPSVGWLGFLNLLRSTDEAKLDLRTISLSLLNAPLFSALCAGDRKSTVVPKRASLGSTMQPASHKPAHVELLDALCDLALADPQAFSLIGSVLSRLSLSAEHFDHLLLNLDPSRHQLNGDAQKSLLARVSETRESRRRHFKQSNTTESTAIAISTHSTSNRLKLLGATLTVLTESMTRLQSEFSSTRNLPNSGLSDATLKTLAVLSPVTRFGKTSNGGPGQSLDCSPLLRLFTPLVNILVDLLNQEQRTAQMSIDGPNEVDVNSSSDSDSESVQNTFEHTIGSRSQPLQMDLVTENDITKLPDLTSMSYRALTRQCVYRLLLCFTAILAEVQQSNQKTARKRRRSHVAEPQASSVYMLTVQSAVDPLFRCLTVYLDWSALHQQVLLCFVHLANMFPLALSQRLIDLIQWVVCSHHLMRLDNVHNLSLIGRLVIIAVPALIRSSADENKTALRVLVLFANGLPNLAQRFPRRRLAFYTGLLRGLAHATSPLAVEYPSPLRVTNTLKTPTDESQKRERLDRRAIVERNRDVRISSWLWTASLVFLVKDWPSESIADQVVPLLVDLHNQFPWDIQVSAWYECIGFLSWLVHAIKQKASLGRGSSNSKHSFMSDKPSRKVEVVDTQISPPSKRKRTASGSSPISLPDQHAFMSDVHVANFCIPHVVEPLLSVLFSETCGTSESGLQHVSPSAVWSLTRRSVQLLNALLSDSTYDHKLQTAADDPLGFGAVYGRLVQQVVQLMIYAAVTQNELKQCVESPSPDASLIVEEAKAVLVGLQNVLIQIHDSVSGTIFIRMVSDLFDCTNHGLRRKALDLLLAKLTSLTSNCEPVPILRDETIMDTPTPVLSKRAQKQRRSHLQLDLTLESGLVQLTAQLTAQYNVNLYGSNSRTTVDEAKSHEAQTFGSSFSRLSLTCLRDLAKILADRYPGEFLRTLDTLLSTPTYWWPTKQSKCDGKSAEPRGSGCAESRSLVCLFLVECLQRLPAHSLCPGASATTNRLSSMLIFCLDHAMTSCGVSNAPRLTLEALRPSESRAELPMKLVAGLMHSRWEHLTAALVLLANLLELAIVHRRSQSSTHTVSKVHSSWITCTDPSHQKTQFLPVADQLLHFILRIDQLDLAGALGANPERSGSSLKQILLLSARIQRLLLFVTDAQTLVYGLNDLLKSCSPSDLTLVHGTFKFLTSLFDACGGAERGHRDQLQHKELHNEFAQLCSVQPDLIGKLLSTVLSLASSEFPDSTQLMLYHAVASLLGAVSGENRLRLATSLIEWAIHGGQKKNDPSAQTLEFLKRMGMVYHIVANLSERIDPEDFSDLAKQINLVDYVVLSFYIVTGQKHKESRKLAARFNMKSCLNQLSDGITPEIHRFVVAGIECLRKWILVEFGVASALDVGSGGSVLALPTAFVSLLDVMSIHTRGSPLRPPTFTDADLSPALDAFVTSVAGDEALLRPLGNALCSRIMHGKHWQMRLSAINLLRRVFNRLSSLEQANDGGDHSGTVAHCLHADALAALSEALEDDRPEVEAAANRLFAELERSGMNVQMTS